MRTVIALLLVLTVLCAASVADADKRKDSIPAVPTGESLDRALDCSGAISISCNDEVQGTNVGAPNNVTYYCDGASWTESGGEAVFELDLPGPGNTTVVATISDNACDLDLYILGSCDEDDCLGWQDVTAAAHNLPPGAYYIVVDGYNSAECPFTLTVECDAVTDACCPCPSYCDTFDFNVSDNGFWTVDCGGAPTWEWVEVPPGGVTCDDTPATHMLATSFGTDYPIDAGEAAVIGPVEMTSECTCMEICHAYRMEEEYDGGNVQVSTDGGSSWDLVLPARTYPNVTYGLTYCVPYQRAFASNLGSVWLIDCFDLSAYVGESILVGFFFGSDYSTQYEGWYIQWVKFGKDLTPVQPSSWGAIKALYR
jgi:hypothetical protein